MASWLMRSTAERAVRVRALAGDIVLYSWVRHFTLTVPLHLQSQPEVVGTLKLYHVSPIPPKQCWKISRFSNKKGKNHLIINFESGRRGELASCPNT